MMFSGFPKKKPTDSSEHAQQYQTPDQLLNSSFP